MVHLAVAGPIVEQGGDQEPLAQPQRGAQRGAFCRKRRTEECPRRSHTYLTGGEDTVVVRVRVAQNRCTCVAPERQAGVREFRHAERTTQKERWASYRHDPISIPPRRETHVQRQEIGRASCRERV